MNKYELALVVSAKIEDDARTATVEKQKSISLVQAVLLQKFNWDAVKKIHNCLLNNIQKMFRVLFFILYPLCYNTFRIWMF